MARSDQFLITCEHGGNRIPQRYIHYFLGDEALLESHRGYDLGALTMARELAQKLSAHLFYSIISRLLIDLNRSIGHSRLYSEAIRKATKPERHNIMERYYLPYRRKIEASIVEAVAQGKRVIHISSHSFTPQVDGKIRNTDIGLLYDPARTAEKEFCKRWQAALVVEMHDLRVRRNYPYIGISDGLTAHLRRLFVPEAYVGIELEINQYLVFKGGGSWRSLREAIIDALRQVM
jgi:predicted N-formylglutamate amidohydrolase